MPIFLFLFLLLSSCSNYKHLKCHSEDNNPKKRIFEEHMLVSNNISFKKQKYKIQEDLDNLLYELSYVLYQNPDRSFIKGFRQMVYHLNDTQSVRYIFDKRIEAIRPDTIRRKPNGLMNWLHQKVGNPTMVIDTAIVRKTAQAMKLFLKQRAYFNAEVDYKINYKGYKANVQYIIETGKPFLLDSIYWYSRDTVIQEILEANKNQTLFRSRSPLSSENINLEISRIRNALLNRGFYALKINDFINYLKVELDTINVSTYKSKNNFLSKDPEQGEPRVNLYFEILPLTDTAAQHQKYAIKNVFITPNEYILKAHQKRIIKKDSFYVVERIVKVNSRNVVLRGEEIMLKDDILLNEKYLPNGQLYRKVQRKVPKIKKVILFDKNELSTNDKVIHVVLNKKLKLINGNAVSIRQINRKKYIRDKIISDAVHVKAGQLFSYANEEKTIQSINELGVFNFARVEFVNHKDSINLLDCIVRMKPSKKQEMGFDFELNNNNTTAYSSSVGFAGNVFYRNKNIFKGAEVFELSLQGGIDFKISGLDSISTNGFFKSAVNLLDINGEANLYIPRFVGLPFIKRLFKMEKAQTKLSVGYQFLQQSTDFQISSFYTKVGYIWSRGPEHSFIWNPFLINLSLEPNLNPSFAASLQATNLPLYESIRASFLIPSMDFSYTYSTSKNKSRGGSWYFKSYFELSGNMVYLFDRLIEPNQQLQFFGVDYAQFFRTEIDLRYSYKLHKRHSIVSRLLLGAIIPYGNTNDLDIPFIKRFTLGGPNSMRAWNLRYLGPGDKPSVEGAEFQLGDIRFEFNSEYRFMFLSWIGGAFFVDVGNIWLLQNNENTPDIPISNPKSGVFSTDFYKQLAIGAGLGLRVDFSFFIFRLDFALQLREPQGYGFKADGTTQYWNFEPFELENRYKFIIAIGYPF